MPEPPPSARRRAAPAPPSVKRSRGLLHKVEYGLRTVERRLQRSAVLRLLEHFGKLSVVVAIVFYLAEAGERRKSRHAQAWQVIQAAHGAGKIPFIEQLNQDGGVLAGLDIRGIEGDTLLLAGADLRAAKFDDVRIRRADFQNANLRRASLAGAVLRNQEVRGNGALLAGARLSMCDLRGADLAGANLAGADLSDADLRGAVLTGADLRDANLSRARVDEHTDLSRCRLAGAAVCAVDLRPAKLQGADFADAVCLMVLVTPEQSGRLRNADRIRRGPQARRSAIGRLTGLGDEQELLLNNIPDVQWCYDDFTQIKQMTLTEIGRLNSLLFSSTAAEPTEITVLPAEEENRVSRALHDAATRLAARRDAIYR